MAGPTPDYTDPGDFVDDPDAGERPLLVPSSVAAERRGGRSLAAQDRLDAARRGRS